MRISIINDGDFVIFLGDVMTAGIESSNEARIYFKKDPTHNMIEYIVKAKENGVIFIKRKGELDVIIPDKDTCSYKNLSISRDTNICFDYDLIIKGSTKVKEEYKNFLRQIMNQNGYVTRAVIKEKYLDFLREINTFIQNSSKNNGYILFKEGHFVFATKKVK